jgi:hypothetical protein
LPLVHEHVRPVVSPGKRGKLAELPFEQTLGGPPPAGGVWLAQVGVVNARQVPGPVVAFPPMSLQYVEPVQAPQVTAAPVQELVSVWLQRAPTPLPHVFAFVQQEPSSPGPARRGPATEHSRPPLQAQSCPTVSPGKRVKVGFALVLHCAPAAPVAPS